MGDCHAVVRIKRAVQDKDRHRYRGQRPGAIITPEVAESLKVKLKNLEAIDVGEGIHYLQEDHPHAIGEGIANWYERLGG